MYRVSLYLLGFTPCAFIYAKELWESLAAVGIKKDVQPWIGMDRRQFARQLDGNEKFDFNVLAKFPATVMKELLWRVLTRDDMGLPERVRRSLPLLLAFEHEPRVMAKMNLPAEKVEKSA